MNLKQIKTTLQQRLIYIQYQKNTILSDLYHIPLILSITGKLDILKIKSSLQQIVNNNSVLRANFFC